MKQVTIKQIAATLCLIVSTACFNFSPWRPAQGTTELSIPHLFQEKLWYCGPAVIAMWRAYRGYPAVSQDAIWNWMSQSYPGHTNPAPGMGATGIAVAGAASNYTGRAIKQDDYIGENQIRQAVADQQEGIGDQRPTIAVVHNGTHAVLVRGATWHELPDALLRPNNEFMKIRDPHPTAAISDTISIGEWFNFRVRLTAYPCTSGLCAINIQEVYQRGSGTAAMTAFEDAGGTYYGPGPAEPTGRWKLDGDAACYWEASDSGPNQCEETAPTGRWKLDGNGGCYWEPNDSGPNQCEPQPRLVAKLASLFRVPTHVNLSSSRSRLARAGYLRAERSALTSPAGSNSRHSAATGEGSKGQSGSRFNGTRVPHPYSQKPAEIFANVRAAIEQTQLHSASDIAELDMRSHELRAIRILDVTSMAERPDYYVVELETTRGAPVAVVAITKAGVIMSVGDMRGTELPKSLALDDAMARAGLHTRAAVKGAKHVWAPNVAEPGSSIYRPLAAVETTSGVIYFNSAGEAFAEVGSSILEEVGAVNAKEHLPPGAKQLRKLQRRIR